MMSKDAYIDSILMLLHKHAGVPWSELQAKTDLRDTLAMCHTKGRDWTQVAIATCKEFGIPVEE